MKNSPEPKKESNKIRKAIIIFAEISVFIFVGSIFIERGEAAVSRINNSWQLISIDSQGNNGKREALEYLNSWQCYGLSKFDWFEKSIIEDERSAISFLKDYICLKKPLSFFSIDLSPKYKEDPPPKYKTYLKNIELENAQLTKAILIESNLEQAILSNADLSEAELNKSILSYAILSNANLQEAKLINTRLFKADMSEANLSYAYLKKAYIANAKLIKATLINADLSEADLSKTDLTEADLTGAKLYKSILENTILTGTNLLHTDLRKAQFNFHPPITQGDKIETAINIKYICDQLKQAINWKNAYRDEIYACGATIPVHPDEK